MRVGLWPLAGAVVAWLLTVVPAQAMWTITATGLWNTNAPVTAYSAPMDTFSFSVKLSAQTFSTIYQDPNISVTTQMVSVQYDLNGVALPVTLWAGPQAGCFGQPAGTLCNVAFFDTALGGGIALAFSDHVVELYGADIGSKGVLVPGHYSFTPNIDDTLVNEGTAVASVTPEPAAWALMLLGVAAVGAAVRAGRARLILA